MNQMSTTENSTRRRIIEAAHRLFLEHGYHGTSIRQIAREAGIALGGIYNHFAGKEDLFAAVLLAHHPYIAILPELAAAQGETIEEVVRDAADRMLRVLEAHPENLHLLFIENVEFEGRHMADLIRHLKPQIRQFAQVFDRAGDDLRPIPIPILIQTFLGLFISYFMTERLVRQQKPCREVRVMAFDHLVEIYLHGILEHNRAGP